MFLTILCKLSHKFSKLLNRNMVPKVIAKSSQSHRRKTCYLRMSRKVIAAKHVIYVCFESHRKVIAAKHVIYGGFAKSSPQSTLFTKIYLQSHRKVIAKSSPLSFQEFR